MIFIEMRPFSRRREEFLNDESFRELQALLVSNPLVGDEIRGTGGLREGSLVYRRAWQTGWCTRDLRSTAETSCDPADDDLSEERAGRYHARTETRSPGGARTGNCPA